MAGWKTNYSNKGIFYLNRELGVGWTCYRGGGVNSMKELFAGCREKLREFTMLGHLQVSRGCCMSLLPQGERDSCIIAKEAYSE